MGGVFGLLGTILELILHILNLSYKTNVAFSEKFMEELTFFLKFKKMTKPVNSVKNHELAIIVSDNRNQNLYQ